MQKTRIKLLVGIAKTKGFLQLASESLILWDFSFFLKVHIMYKATVETI
jgi:hypothetical protein